MTTTEVETTTTGILGSGVTTTMAATTGLLASSTTTGYETTTELLGSVTTTAEADTTATMNTTTTILGSGTTTMDTTTAILGSGTTTNYETTTIGENTTTAVPTTTEVVCSQQQVCRVVNTCVSSSSSAFSTSPHQVPAASNILTSAANRRDDVVCNGCNCVQTIVLSRGDATTITSPEFNSSHRKRAACSWKIKTKSGRLRLSFSEFDLESGAECSKEYLQMGGPVQDHGRPKLCGNNVPDGTSFESKYHILSLKFVSNGRRRKSGFKAKIVAI